ncbi:hypothetical protein CPTAKMECS_108 [Salmonella phage vB_SenS-AKM_ECS]|uniref:Uncharacterized protein n=1 Tax=Salmonella phage vB_SenS-AKM_HA2021_32 TaxID=3158841 RepID=A0AAU7L3V2_9CAUD|nr:hypothetical protein CPTAKMECS_108 [Salmonella phage vB_SenS-AKM_ECS]
MKKLVKFKCCGSEHIFTRLREFKMCDCGKSGYDAGDGFYTRTLGNFNDLEFINLEEVEKQKIYECSQCGEHDECHWECPTCGHDDMLETD